MWAVHGDFLLKHTRQKEERHNFTVDKTEHLRQMIRVNINNDVLLIGRTCGTTDENGTQQKTHLQTSFPKHTTHVSPWEKHQAPLEGHAILYKPNTLSNCQGQQERKLSHSHGQEETKEIWLNAYGNLDGPLEQKKKIRLKTKKIAINMELS